MLVRMRGDISGLRDGKPWPKNGHTIELPDHEAEHLIAAGTAVEIKRDDPLPVETATVDAKPKASRKGGLTKASVAANSDPAPVETATVPDAPVADSDPPAVDAPDAK